MQHFMQPEFQATHTETQHKVTYSYETRISNCVNPWFWGH